MLNVSDVASNYAADAGLNLGTVFGTNVASGINTTIVSSLMKSTGLAQGLNSMLAKDVLGADGLLGKAGSGAQSWSLTSTQPGLISFGSGTPAQAAPPQPTVIQNHLYIDGQAIRFIAQQEVAQGMGQLGSALGTVSR